MSVECSHSSSFIKVDFIHVLQLKDIIMCTKRLSLFNLLGIKSIPSLFFDSACRALAAVSLFCQTEAPCAYYMKTGACKFGQTCKYDHPPPQEIIAKAVEQARGEIPVSCDVSMPGSNESDSQDATPLPPGTDAPAVTAACASST